MLHGKTMDNFLVSIDRNVTDLAHHPHDFVLYLSHSNLSTVLFGIPDDDAIHFSNSTFSIGEWHHVVISVSFTTHIYLDGQLVYRRADYSSDDFRSVTGTDPARITLGMPPLITAGQTGLPFPEPYMPFYGELTGSSRSRWRLRLSLV